jgi:hypothetical protein
MSIRWSAHVAREVKRQMGSVKGREFCRHGHRWEGNIIMYLGVETVTMWTEFNWLRTCSNGGLS